MCYRIRILWCHSPQLASFSVSPASFEMIFFLIFFLSFLIVSTLVWRSSGPQLRARHRVASFSINYTSYIFKKIKCIFSCCCCCWCSSAADGGSLFYSAFCRIRQNKARQQKQLNRFWKRQHQQITCVFFFCFCIKFLSLCRNLHLRKGFYYSVEMKSLETGAHRCWWSISYLSINAGRGGGICIITQNWQTLRLASV